MVTGLVVDAAGFEVLAGDERIRSRRSVGPADAEFVTGLADRYVRAGQAGSDADMFVELGRELYSWLDGDPRAAEHAAGAGGPAAGVRGDRAAVAVEGAVGGAAGAVELLARFCAARRSGPAEARSALDQFRLGRAFMASSPRGQHELDLEAEEATILATVGESNVDLMVDDTGDPEQLACRLAGLGGSYESDGLGAGSDVAAPCAESGASQLLLIVDTRPSGDAMAAGEVAARITQQSACAGGGADVAPSGEMARDGLFGQRLTQLLACVPEAEPDTRALLVRY